MKKIILSIVTFFSFICSSLALAKECTPVSGVASVACRVFSNLNAIGVLLLGASYIAGMAFGIAAIVKFKAHKENPTQVPLSQGIVLLFVGAALIGIPSVYTLTTKTLFVSGPTKIISGLF
jgi:intracellular multiplication protein IcmD